jgi:hypothetical protein
MKPHGLVILGGIVYVAVRLAIQHQHQQKSPVEAVPVWWASMGRQLAGASVSIGACRRRAAT